jgi:glycolate oxidase FAD binding subunit
VAHADGTITKAGARVVKNATAYDLTKLYAGSHGTLGVLLEATLRLQPRPAVERGWLLTGAPLERCHEVAIRILGSHLAPNRLELVDRTGAVGWGSPESDPALVVSFAGVREAVQDQGSSVTTLARESGVEAAEIQNAGTVCQALQDFPWRAPGLGASGVRALWRGSVLSSDCAKAMHAVRDATSRFGEGAIAATVSHGALRGVLGASSIDDVRSGLAVAREALGALGGFLVVMDAPGPLRGTLNVWGPMPAEVALMRQIKMAFDPKGILNPGRFVDGI